MEQPKRPEYGVDDLTFSLNDARDRKTEDWHSDHSGKVTVNGQTYYLNGYQKTDSWIAGKLVPAKQSSQAAAAPAQPKAAAIDDDIPLDF